MTGFINPDSIKPNGSSDREEVIYSHLGLVRSVPRKRRAHIQLNEIRGAG